MRKRNKNNKQTFKAFTIAGFLLVVLSFAVFPHATFADTTVNECITTAPSGYRVPQFIFPIPGKTIPTSTGSASVSGTIMCCCSFKDFPDGPKDTRLKSCPSVCSAYTTTDVKRNQFLNTPKDVGLAPDTSSDLYPLKNVASTISKWYAAMFYLAVVLAIIQIFRGGIEYAIAAGNSSKTEEAKGIIVEAVIGLGVALLAAGILVFLRGPGVFTFTS